MPEKFKENDVVYFKEKRYHASPQYPVKGTEYESLGVVEKIVFGIITVEWDSGVTYEYNDHLLRHKHRIIKFIRYLFDDIMEIGVEIRKEMSTYLQYRKFKKGDIVCLKQPTSSISTCDIGKIYRKSYPHIMINWSVGDTYLTASDIEHYNPVDPNRLFKSYKRNML